MTATVFVSSPRRKTRGSPKPFLSMKSGSSSRRTLASSFCGPNLSALARETKRKVQWEQVLRGSTARGAQWKWIENARHFAIYNKQDSSSGYGVLSIGTIKGTVPEVVSLLASNSQSDYEQKMAALHDKEFKSGSFITKVADEIVYESNDDSSEPVAAQLTLRSATFARTRWLKRDDEWTFLDSTQYDREKQRFERLMTTLKPDDILPPSERKPRKFGDAKQVHDVVSGYYVHPEDAAEASVNLKTQAPAVRIHYYAELAPASSGRALSRLASLPQSRKEASNNAIKQRLMQMAKDCDRISQLVRRRRLGIQVLVDQRRVLPPTNVKCVNCDKNQIIAKLCRVCGQGVCGDCSDKYERETHVLRGKRADGRRVRIETIRVCDPCLARVETADYSLMNDRALVSPTLVPSSPNTSATGDLKQLLHDALLEAPSRQRKSAVMNVIRCVLDQEKALTPPATPVSVVGSTSSSREVGSILLTPLSSDSDYVNALDCLDVKTIHADELDLADKEGRAYPVETKKDLAAPLAFPVPDNEQRRASEVDKLGIIGSGTSDELNIICDIAAKELDAFATIVTIITPEEQHVVAANVPALENMRMKREDSFCQHTIMSEKPLIVPNPEADVRFSRIMPVTEMGLKFYCGFPIVSGEDNSVIGTLCCVDQKKHDLTEAQFSAMQRLADTAGKVVRIQSQRRRSSAAPALVSQKS